MKLKVMIYILESISPLSNILLCENPISIKVEYKKFVGAYFGSKSDEK